MCVFVCVYVYVCVRIMCVYLRMHACVCVFVCVFLLPSWLQVSYGRGVGGMGKEGVKPRENTKGRGREDKRESLVDEKDYAGTKSKHLKSSLKRSRLT